MFDDFGLEGSSVNLIFVLVAHFLSMLSEKKGRHTSSDSQPTRTALSRAAENKHYESYLAIRNLKSNPRRLRMCGTTEA